MSNLTFVFLVDVEIGAEVEKVFTPTSKNIKAFGGEKSLYDFIATVIDSKHEEVVSRISKVTKYTYGGAIENFSLVFNDGNLELTSTGVIQSDVEVQLP